MLITISIVIIFVVAIAVFMRTAPQFGARLDSAVQKQLANSPNYSDGSFQNLIKTEMNIKASDYPKMLLDLIFNGSKGTPKSPLPTNFDLTKPETDTSVFVTWFGHSAILLQFEGKHIFLDPMLGPASAPVSFTTKRFAYKEPIDISKIEKIDIVVFSHDHYDHLDYPTVLKIKDKVAQWVTPLGLGEHLVKWGVERSKITQLDWWSATELEGVKLVATPARHFSGRRTGDRNATLWASWVIQGQKNKVYFSGDGGYANHFKEIGDKFGPFDFAMVECGQYHELWSQIHMMPEETVQAGIDVRAEKMMPIHWGAFKLAPHDWRDPIIRAKKEADRLGVTLLSPVIGEKFNISEQPMSNWWEKVD